MKIYTRRGDAGETGLMGGPRVSKAHVRVEAYGTVDELNSFLGRAVHSVTHPDVSNRLRDLQHDLFRIGAILSTPDPEPGRKAPQLPEPPTARVTEMESWIDEATGAVPPLREFVLPGGCLGAADLHVARTVCRRAERRIAALADEAAVDEDVLRYINRLSDLLFAWARLENEHAGDGDVVWSKDR